MSYDVKKWLTASFNFNGILAKAKESASAYATDPFNMPAYYRLLNEDGSYNYYAAPGFNPNRSLETELALFLMTAIRKMRLYIVGS